jgi:hypothetical protein
MFENLSEVRRANTTGPKGTRKAQFQMRANEAKSTIIFSSDQFAEMNIADNSLSQFVDEAGGRVFLAVMPGNTGTFAKTNARGTKGKKFKNEKLVANLVEQKYDFATIGLYKIGEEDGKTLYQVTGNGAEIYVPPVVAPTATEEAAPVTEEATQADVEAETSQIHDEEAAVETDEREVEEGTDVEADESIEDALTGDAKPESELEF